MSIVTVQLGQCGNQVGQELFDVICKDARDGQKRGYSDASTARFFHETTTGGRTAVSDALRIMIRLFIVWFGLSPFSHHDS